MYFYQLPSWKKNRKTISELFRDILKQYPDAELKMFLKKIYCYYRDGGLKGRLFFIKDFGFVKLFYLLKIILKLKIERKKKATKTSFNGFNASL